MVRILLLQLWMFLYFCYKGESNSQFGTCWITNGTENKKIKKTEKLPKGWEFGRK
jgi:hypothetical protein